MGLFWDTVWEYSSSRWRRQGDGSWRQLVTWHLQTGSREKREEGCDQLYFSFPSIKHASPHLQSSYLDSHDLESSSQTHPRFVLMVILHVVKFTIKINYHTNRYQFIRVFFFFFLWEIQYEPGYSYLGPMPRVSSGWVLVWGLWKKIHFQMHSSCWEHTVPRCSKNEFCCWFLAGVILSNLSSHSGSILVDLSNRQ